MMSKQHSSMKLIEMCFFLAVGLLLSVTGGAWLLFGVPFEDPWQDWLQRATVLISGLFILVACRKNAGIRL